MDKKQHEGLLLFARQPEGLVLGDHAPRRVLQGGLGLSVGCRF